MEILIAESDEQIAACYPVMRELRPHLLAERFVGIVRDMQREGYSLAYLAAEGRVVAVAGFRTKRTLFCDKFIYVDDLVTLASERSKGHGAAFINWLEARAQDAGCADLRLDSGIQREDAHRFYEDNGMAIVSYHFRVVLDARVPWSQHPG